jgi:hypothetical protein
LLTAGTPIDADLIGAPAVALRGDKPVFTHTDAPVDRILFAGDENGFQRISVKAKADKLEKVLTAAVTGRSEGAPASGRGSLVNCPALKGGASATAWRRWSACVRVAPRAS